MAVGQCTYCLEERKLTDDHIPPKVLLAKPYPVNLPTVPSCHECNKAFQKDDEYTASVIPMDVRALKNPVARERALKVIRGLRESRAQGFAKYLAGQRSWSKVVGMFGEPLGALIDVDRKRVDATGTHIVRGLYRYEAKKPLRLTTDIVTGGSPGYSPDQAVMKEFERIWQTWPGRWSRELGPGFSYAAAYGHGFSVWVLLLYGYFSWVVFTSEKERLPRP